MMEVSYVHHNILCKMETDLMTDKCFAYLFRKQGRHLHDL